MFGRQRWSVLISDDTRLLLFLWLLCRLVQAGILLYVWRIHTTYRPARDWAVGSLLALPGLLLVALRDVIPLWASVLPGNASILAGVMVVDFGVMRAAGRTPPWRSGILLCLAAVGLSAWFTLVRPDYPARLSTYHIAVTILDAMAVASCLTCRARSLCTTLRLVAAIFILHFLSGTWRAAGALAGHIPSILTPDLSQIQYGVVIIVCVMALTALLALLTSQKIQEELHDLAHQDPLTKASNRRSLEMAVADEWSRAVRDNKPVACLMLDIDHFKRFNDHYGHQAGDDALVAVSSIARGMLRAEDTWCRFGGEEFLALLPGTDRRGAQVVAERLREKIAAMVLSGPGEPAAITVSIGVADAHGTSESWSELVNRSDRALYLAKKKGRNRVETAADDIGPSIHSAFVRLAWNDIYACGREPIDSQHQQLFNDANELLLALMTGLPKTVCQKRIDALLTDVLVHFRDEEALLREVGYPEADHHAATHAALVVKAREMGQRYERDDLTLGDVFDFLAMEVVSRHMLVEDRRFFPYLGPDEAV